MKRAFLFFSATLLLSTCGGGFQAAKPTQGEIIHIRNTEVDVLELDEQREPQPTPIPEISGAEQFRALPIPEGEFAPIEPKTNEDIGPRSNDFGEVVEANLSETPFDTAGRLNYFIGDDYRYCSAQVVGPDADVILTAAHCVYNDEKNLWGSNFRFRLGYDEGAFTGDYSWSCSAIFSGWTAGNRAVDYAFIKLRAPAPESLGIAFDDGASTLNSMGYPSNFFSGQKLATVQGRRGTNAGAGVTQMADNPFGPGSSGGAWYRDNSAIGVNSYLRTGISGSVFGPRFDANTIRLFEYVSGDCVEKTVPPGGSENVAQADNTNVISYDTTRISSEFSVQSIADTSCQCDNSTSSILTNSSLTTRLFTVRNHYYAGSSHEKVDDDLQTFLLSPNEERNLGCNTLPADNGQCLFTTEPVVTSARTVNFLSDNKAFPEVRSVTPQFCEQHCIDTTGTGFCYPLGSGAAQIAASLNATYDAIMAASIPGAGVVLEKSSVISEFGGDPTTIEDPCTQSDFYQVGSDMINDGIGCRMTTPRLADTDNELRMSMQITPRTLGRKTTDFFGPQTSQVTRDVASFSDRNAAPTMEFYGTSTSDELNSRYGGKITAMTQRDNVLVITTENGCIGSPIR